jgi:hypothetical protein
MENLATRLSDFRSSLEEYNATDHPSWQVGQIFNALITASKQELANDPVVQTIDLAEQGSTMPGVMGKPITKMDAGAMRAAVQQVLSAMGQTGPMVA